MKNTSIFPVTLLCSALTLVLSAGAQKFPTETTTMAGGGSADSIPAISSPRGPNAGSQQPAPASAVLESYGRLPLSFELNQGQMNPQVKFFSRSLGYNLYLTRTETVLAFLESSSAKTQFGPFGAKPRSVRMDHGKASQSWRMRLLGSNPISQVSGLDELPGKSNYFVGNDPGRWRTNVPTYARVQYKAVYPGIDVAYYGNQRQLEFDFIVAPGADPNTIRLSFHGGKLRVDANGDLLLKSDGHEMRLHKPLVYQPAGTQATRRRESVDGRYLMASNGVVRFEVGAYDHSRPLVIDPVVEAKTATPPTLDYSTYLGGSIRDEANGIAIDSAGNAYIVGNTRSSDFPATPGIAQHNFNGATDAFVTKLRADGSTVAYSTYLGGSALDFGAAIAVDSSGNAYLTGSTQSFNFPTTKGAYQQLFRSTALGINGFVSKLSPDGSALLYSSFLGGSSNDQAFGIAIDSSGSAYVTGNTNSTNFPITPGAYQTTLSNTSNNAFITKFAPDGSQLVYSTLLGGNSQDLGIGIAVDAAGSAYVTGFTTSSTFPTTPGVFQPTLSNAATNAFVTKLKPDGSGLLYSTFLGGSFDDAGYAIAVDSSGATYVAGSAGSPNFPVTPGAFQTTLPPSAGSNGFVTKMKSDGSGLIYSTFLGGSKLLPKSAVGRVIDFTNSIALDSAGVAYVSGLCNTSDFPTTPDAYQATVANASATEQSAFVTKIKPDGTGLLYSTYLSGSLSDRGNGIATDSVGNAYVTGSTSSSDFPITTEAFQNFNREADPNNGSNAFITKVPTSDFSLKAAPGSSLSQTVTAGQTVTYSLQLNPLNGLTGSASLACSGAPATVTCTPSTPTLTLGVSPAAFTVSVATMVPTLSSNRSYPFQEKSPPLPLGAFAALLPAMMVILVSRRRSWHPKSAALAVLCLVLTLSACGGGGRNGGTPTPSPTPSSSPTPTPTPHGGTPPGVYTMTLTGTQQGVSRSINLTLKVQ